MAQNRSQQKRSSSSSSMQPAKKSHKTKADLLEEFGSKVQENTVQLSDLEVIQSSSEFVFVIQKIAPHNRKNFLMQFLPTLKKFLFEGTPPYFTVLHLLTPFEWGLFINSWLQEFDFPTEVIVHLAQMPSPQLQNHFQYPAEFIKLLNRETLHKYIKNIDDFLKLILMLPKEHHSEFIEMVGNEKIKYLVMTPNDLYALLGSSARIMLLEKLGRECVSKILTLTGNFVTFYGQCGSIPGLALLDWMDDTMLLHHLPTSGTLKKFLCHFNSDEQPNVLKKIIVKVTTPNIPLLRRYSDDIPLYSEILLILISPYLPKSKTQYAASLRAYIAISLRSKIKGFDPTLPELTKTDQLVRRLPEWDGHIKDIYFELIRPLLKHEPFLEYKIKKHHEETARAKAVSTAMEAYYTRLKK